MTRWTREGRVLSYDGKPAIAIDRILDPVTHGAKLDPCTCDAIADYVHAMLNTLDLDALRAEWMKR